MDQRLIIRGKDIQIIEGLGKTRAFEKLKLAKVILGKQQHQRVTILEYAEYSGINSDEIKRALKLT